LPDQLSKLALSQKSKNLNKRTKSQKMRGNTKKKHSTAVANDSNSAMYRKTATDENLPELPNGAQHNTRNELIFSCSRSSPAQGEVGNRFKLGSA